jgi:hypothetical protein
MLASPATAHLCFVVANPDWATKIRAGRSHDLKDYHISLKSTLR